MAKVMSCAHSVHYLTATPPIKGFRVQIGPKQWCICVGQKQRNICVILNQLSRVAMVNAIAITAVLLLQSQHPVAKSLSGGLLYQLRSYFHPFRDDYEFLTGQDWTHSQSSSSSPPGYFPFTNSLHSQSSIYSRCCTCLSITAVDDDDD
jgi:hypothetical protein